MVKERQKNTPPATLILIHPVLKLLCLPLTSLPTVFRPVNPLHGCLSWSQHRICHHWQRSNWKYGASLYRETPLMSHNIKCSVRPPGRWLFSALGGRRDSNNLYLLQHRLNIWGTCHRGSRCRSARRNPFYGGKRCCRAACQERSAT